MSRVVDQILGIACLSAVQQVTTLKRRTQQMQKQYTVFCPFSNKSYAHGTFKSTVISHHHVTFRIRIVESWEQRPLPLHYQPGH